MPFLTRLHGIAGPGPKVWTLSHPLIYRDPVSGVVYLCPRNQVSDLASIPRLARWLIPGNGRERAPAVVHDRAYERAGAIEIIENPGILPRVPDDYSPWLDADARDPAALTPIETQIYRLIEAGTVVVGTAALSRKDADRVFLDAMKCAGVGFVGRRTMYSAVRTGGWVAWRGHDRRAEG